MASKCAKLIKAAARKGQISDAQAEALLEDLQRQAKRRASMKAQKLSEALKDIAGEMVMRQETEDLIRQRNILLSHHALESMFNDVTKARNWGNRLVEKLENIGNAGKHKSRSFIARLTSRLEHDGVLDLARNADRDTGLEVERELWRLSGTEIPQSKNGDAVKIAKALYEINDEATSLMNRHGAYIRRAEGWAGPQTHDRGKIRRLGGTGFLGLKKDKALSKEAYWRTLDENGIGLNWERTLDGQSQDMFKKSFHDNLYSGVYGPDVPEFNPERFLSHGTMANRVSSERVMWFADPDSAFKYRELLGRGDWWENWIRHLDNRGRHAAILEHLGPNPANNLKLLRERLNKARRDLPDPDVHKGVNASRIDHMWSVLNGEANVSVNPGFSTFIDNVKATQNLSKLGGAWITSFADPMFFNSAMARQGIGAVDRYMAMIESMIPRDASRKEVIEAFGWVSDAIIHNTNGRYSNEFAPWRLLRKASDFQFKVSLLTPWTEMFETSAGEILSYRLGKDGSSALADLSPIRRRMLEAYGMDSASWDVIRSHSRNIADGKSFIAPDLARMVPDTDIAGVLSKRGMSNTSANRQRWRDEMSSTLGGYFEDFIREAVPRPGIREKAFMSQGLRRGTIAREALELFGQFKSFPVSAFNIMRRRTGADWADVMPRHWILMLAAQTTVAGYIAMSAKDWLAGRHRRPLLNENGTPNAKTFLEAARRGGGLGILGDVLFGDYDRNMHSFVRDIAGPSFSELDSLMALGRDGFEALTDPDGPSTDSLKYQAFRLAERNTPFANLWYLKPLMNYYFFYVMREQLNPGSLKAMERHTEDITGQKAFLKPSRVVGLDPGDRLEKIVEAHTSNLP